VEGERFIRDGEIIEVRDGRELHVTLVEPGATRSGLPGYRIGTTMMTGPQGGRQTTEQRQTRAKGRGRFRSSAYRLGEVPERDRRCRWCRCDLPIGTEALVRWRERIQRYVWVCIPCGNKHGYKVVRGGKKRRPKPPATAEDLQRLQDHWQGR
jgi:hypothetical protein